MESHRMTSPTSQIHFSSLESAKACPQCGRKAKFKADPKNHQKVCPHCGYVLPSQIAHFKLLQIIGTGGMGAVYRGLDTSLERHVAVKVMREEFARNPEFVERFLREARAAAALNHPHVAQIYSFGEQRSRYYLVMELLPNGSLDDRIEKEKRLSEIEVLDVGIHVASGLQAAHERGLIHRDIKPGNILFAQDGTAKVVDFGLACLEDKVGSNQEGVWGTPYYIAPEKVADNKEDFRSDIYSLGGTLFHALAGRAPFEAGTSTEVVLKHLRSVAVSLRAFAPDCTLQTAEVIGRMLKRDPEERPQTYEELLNELAYARQAALEKKPKQIEVEDDFSMTTLVGTLLLILVSLGVGIWCWINREKIFGGEESVSPPPSVQTTNSPSQIFTPPTQNSPSQLPPVAQPVDYALQIERAHKTIMSGDLKKAFNQLEAIQRKMPSDHELGPWVRLHSARIFMLMGSDANSLLGLITEKTTPESFTGNVSPSRYPFLLAWILLGKIFGDPLDKMISSLPDGMKACAHFDAGEFSFQQNQLSEAARHWRIYLNFQSVPSEYEWVLFYQKIARDFVNEYNSLKKIEKEVADLEVTNDFSKIKSLLEENQSSWQTPMIRARIADLVEKNRQALAKKQKEEEEKRKTEHAALLEIENKLIDTMLAQKQTLQATYQLDQILQGWKNIELKIKSEENRKVLQYYLAVAQSLAEYKNQLMNDVQASPYTRERIVTRANLKMVGDLYQVKEEKLFFRKELGPGQYGEMACRWAELLPGAVLELGDFYLLRLQERPEPNRSEIARRALTLAVFAKEYRLSEDYIRKYLSLADQMGPFLKESRDLLFSQPPKK